MAKKKLHRDRAAGDTCARVSRRISLHVISFLVNDERSALIREKPVTSVGQTNARVCQRLICCSIRLHREIHHIAGVRSLRILHAVHFGSRIEVSTRRLEVRSFAFCHLVDVNAVLAETERCLRMGGLVYSGVPFYYPNHGFPYDFRRFSPLASFCRETHKLLIYQGLGQIQGHGL